MAQTDGAGSERPERIFGQAPLPPISGVNGGVADGAGPMRWTSLLVWFMRMMALAWITKGLYNWTVILGANPNIADFATLPHLVEATFIFFAVADLIAAIGLWLASPWGGVLWLVCAICEAASPLFGVKSAFANVIGIGVNTAFIAVYFALSWLASNERD
jgi:hypothetical protein